MTLFPYWLCIAVCYITMMDSWLVLVLVWPRFESALVLAEPAFRSSDREQCLINSGDEATDGRRGFGLWQHRKTLALG